MKFGYQLNERQNSKKLSTFSKCIVLMSVMSQQSHLTKSVAWRVDNQLEGSKAEVTETIRVSQSVFFRIWKHFWETGNAGQRPEQGRRCPTKIDIQC
ncbi:hypothetical protein TNCT_10121 [Trichonephila clavata]|uniref:Uncharacterized protein n=1 Tax=Trichonephila clavata TaxID=2740835 RepID=A0A8X6FA50_TRICU|nr:hypothetical protein TNCT_10121 [Trichonephila clavata]